MGGHLRLKIVSWIFGILAALALTGTAHGASESTGPAVDIPGILVVDDRAPIYSHFYTDVLRNLGLTYHVWYVEDYGVPSAAATLSHYPKVIWVTGPVQGFDPAAEASLTRYLDGGGGSLFLISQMYLASRGLTPFAQAYLGVGSFIEDPGYQTVEGQGPAFSSLGPYSLAFNPFVPNDCDQISPAPGAEVAFRWEGPVLGGSGNAGVSKIGPDYRTIFLAFPFEALPTSEDQLKVMDAALEFLGTVFADVPPGHWAKKWVEALYRKGVTDGCALHPRYYCPDGPVTREMAAVLLLRSKENAGYAPSPCTTRPFYDVAVESPYCPWIQELARRGITSGCGNGDFCPSDTMPRQQAAFFLLKTLEGSGYTPPPCTARPFDDVPAESPFCPWIQELALRGFTTGCGNGNYCPGDSVNRAQMAVFLVKTFNLPLF